MGPFRGSGLYAGPSRQGDVSPWPHGGNSPEARLGAVMGAQEAVPTGMLGPANMFITSQGGKGGKAYFFEYS